MLLYKKGDHCWLVYRDKVYRQQVQWDELINRSGLHAWLLTQLSNWELVQTIPEDGFDAPIQHQEVWAAGVTYLRSKQARMEESKDAGGGDFYDKVYVAERPELFFKAQPYRVSAPGTAIRIRQDSTWNVPEPELTLFVCASGTIEGYTIGNDVSSRSIEGENPLYLPQAKSYNGAAALGPCLYVPEQPIDPDTLITLKIVRDGRIVFDQSVYLSQMKRSHKELVSWLTKELDFPYGVFLMTGTGIVPPDDFTLLPGDVVSIIIPCIGILTNNVSI
jgi:2-dehydro-3-deoxy-D-arabinonate dehydratase